MLIKMLKYELKWNYQVLAIFYALALILEMLGDILSGVAIALSEICMTFALETMACALIVGTVRILIRFVKTTYQDEAYLTHTLPIDKKTMLTSKTLSAIITTVTTLIITIICLYRICINPVIMSNHLSGDITALIQMLIIIFKIHIHAILIELIGYTSIIIGHKQRKDKLGSSILIGIITYIIIAVIFAIISALIGALLESGNITFDNTLEIKLEIVRLILMTIIYVIFGKLFNKISLQQLKKGINID